MRLKNTLWALAFACAAVSCSDDLDDGPNNNGNNNAGLEGPTTFMKISINQGTSTKAPTGGEIGDMDKGEVGKVEEYEVKDITVVLYANPDPEEGKEGQDADKTLQPFGPDSKLVGAGYAKVEKTNVGTDPWHSREATVTITLTDDQDAGFDGKTYGIIAVTNLGSEDVLKKKIGKTDSDINIGYKLANLIQTEVKNETGFIMSTHNDLYGSEKLFDKVTLKAGVNPESAPTADVHVERLAAKIRISKYAQAENFIYNIDAQNNLLGEAKVRLDEVVIVNKLTSGTYLLKRVTENTGGEDDKDLPDLPASGYDHFLGNEEWKPNFNYVIDPWTRAKETLEPKEDKLKNRDGLMAAYEDQTRLAYDNDFFGDNYTALWTSLKDKKTLAANKEAFEGGINSLDLCYTQENTTSADMSKNGYSTGALFKATYFPKKYMSVVIDEATKEQKVKPVDVEYEDGYDNINEETSPAKNKEKELNFYVYNGKIYDSYATIFNEFAWTQQKELDKQEDVKIYSYEDFSGDNAEKINASEFFKHLLSDFSDPLGYIDYLKDKLFDPSGKLLVGETGTLQGHDIENYIGYHQEDINKTIKVYDNFVCYYPYWIRHANNDKFPDMGIMEFGIVRNNIYDMTVEGFNGLGLSGVDKPNPGNPDEEDKHYFNVNIKVKNWVVRKNSGIIL
ncbi:Mfa1 family fimbria major subunit [Parabacteroides sp.]